MERLLLYLDDLDDLYGMVGLIVERLRRFLLVAIACLLTCAIVPVATWLAREHPPIALATIVLLFVAQMYHSVTTIKSDRLNSA